MSDRISSLRSGQSVPSVNRTDREITDNHAANAKGCPRQPAQIPSPPSLADHDTFVDQGAAVRGISRAENSLISDQLVSKSAGYGEEAAQTEALAKLESIISLSENNLCSAMDGFFQAWQSLNCSSETSTGGGNVLAAGKQLTDTFQQMDRDLAEIQADIDRNLASTIDGFNKHLMHIDDLNTQIITQEAEGVPASNLREERNRLLQSVAETAGIRYNEMNNGGVSVQVASGVALVLPGEVGSLSSERRDDQIQLKLNIGSTSADLNDNDLGGNIKGLLTVRDETIAQARAALDQLAGQFAESVNARHASLLNRDNNSVKMFFSISPSSNDGSRLRGAAGTISVASTEATQVVTDTSNGETISTLPMVDLQGERTMDSGVTFQEFFERLATGIRIEVSRNTTALESDQDSLIQLQNLRESITGVSTNEEMVLLSQYQSGYQAAVKNLSVVQDMLDALLAKD